MTPTQRKHDKEIAANAVALGESGRAESVPELLSRLSHPSANVRRLAASALGKLAPVADASAVVLALTTLLRDPHPQVRQYAIKSLVAYGLASEPALPDLQDMVDRPTETDYNRRDAEKAIATLCEARRTQIEQARIPCQRCHRTVTPDEYARAQRAFQRPYCDTCFNEVYLRRRNYDTQIELHKTIPTTDGRWVQSDGERIIADYLAEHNIVYRYDERLQIIDGYAIRPDYYLPEFDLFIEYWGMDTTDYKIGMLKKQKLYKLQGKRLLSLSYKDKPRLREALREKLSRYMRLPDTSDDAAQQSRAKGDRPR
jgi:hypothetical protein